MKLIKFKIINGQLLLLVGQGLIHDQNVFLKYNYCLKRLKQGGGGGIEKRKKAVPMVMSG